MEYTAKALKKPNGLLILPTLLRLAGWRFKNMWRFLLICWLGMLAMVVLVCAIPLFSRVALSAGIRNLGLGADRSQRDVTVQVYTDHPTSTLMDEIQPRIDQLLHQGEMGRYLHEPPVLSVQVGPFIELSAGKDGETQFNAIGQDTAQLQKMYTLKEGRFPQASSGDTLEILLNKGDATALNAHPGTIIKVDKYNADVSSEEQSAGWAFKVVGIVKENQARNGNALSGIYYVSKGGQKTRSFDIIAARQPLFDLLGDSPVQTDPNKNLQGSTLFWNYPFDYSRLDVNNLNALAAQGERLNGQMYQQLASIDGVQGYVSGFAIYQVSSYITQMVLLQVVITILLFLILVLVLFLVSMQADLLVERQLATIATLRSRGATLRNVFSTFLLQALLLSVTAFVIGPILALFLVQQMAHLLLTPESQNAVNVITNNPIQALQGVLWYAFVAVLVSFVVMIIAINRAAKIDIVTLRRESSRNKRKSFWRRMYLDWVFILLTLAGYILYTYVKNIVQLSNSGGSSAARYLVDAFAFIAPSVVVAATLMLFLRLLPLLLRLAGKLAARQKSAPAMLALEQMARQPRTASRIIVVLALATASAIFMLSLIATKYQATIDNARFSVSADFSGRLPASDDGKSFEDVRSTYSKLTGVTSATLGKRQRIQLKDNGAGSYGPPPNVEIQAADAATYSKTLYPCSVCSSSSFSTFTDQLVSHRADAQNSGQVYAVVDEAMAHYFGLTPGAHFKLPVSDNDADLKAIDFVVLAVVDNLPGFYHSPSVSYSDLGMLVDFESYRAAYAKKNNNTQLTPDYIWLQTNDDAASLKSVRATLPGLIDARALLAAEIVSPIYLNITGVLGIGVAAALVLALVGTLLASWLSASSRQTSFAVLRALGMAPRQVGAILLWEQGVIYVLALVLGLGLGAMLTTFVTPIVSFIGMASIGSVVSTRQFDVPPIQLVLPYTQFGLALASFAVICIVALVVMARIVSRPGIGQRLRLNED